MYHLIIGKPSLSSTNTCLSNISTNYWITNSSLNTINTCLQNVSLNYWKTNASLSSTNTCLSNISTNYWITNNSLLNVNAYAYQILVQIIRLQIILYLMYHQIIGLRMHLYYKIMCV